jgi:hypothetical protein
MLSIGASQAMSWTPASKRRDKAKDKSSTTAATLAAVAAKEKEEKKRLDREGRALVKAAVAAATSSSSSKSNAHVVHITILCEASFPSVKRDIRKLLIKRIDSGHHKSVSLILSSYLNKVGTLNYRQSYTKRTESDASSLVEPNVVQSSPLMACINSSIASPMTKAKILEMLLLHGANPNEVDDDGDTPLHIICNMPSLDTSYGHCVRLLMLYGASAEVRDSNGQTPLHLTITTLAGPSAALITSGAEFIVDPVPIDMATEKRSSEFIGLMFEKRKEQRTKQVGMHL